jgi:hypothetical protein
VRDVVVPVREGGIERAEQRRGVAHIRARDQRRVKPPNANAERRIVGRASIRARVGARRRQHVDEMTSRREMRGEIGYV